MFVTSVAMLVKGKTQKKDKIHCVVLISQSQVRGTFKIMCI